MNQESLFDIRELVVEKRHSTARFELYVPKLRIFRQEMLAITGPSGCGKSSLLDVLALAAPIKSVKRFIFSPRDGEIFDVGESLLANQLDRLASIRRRYLGYVLQIGGLLPFLNVDRNMAMLLPWQEPRVRERIKRVAKDLGIAEQLKKNRRRCPPENDNGPQSGGLWLVNPR